MYPPRREGSNCLKARLTVTNPLRDAKFRMARVLQLSRPNLFGPAFARSFVTRDSQGSIDRPAFDFASADPKQTQSHPRLLKQVAGEGHQHTSTEVGPGRFSEASTD